MEVQTAYGERAAIPGKGICDWIQLPRDVSNSAVIFRNGGEMALLSFGDRIRFLRYGIDEGHVVREDVEMDGLEEVAKMAYGSMDGEELPIERRITLLGGGQLPTEEGDGGGAIWSDLLKGCTDGVVAGVRQELELRVLCRKR